MTKREELVETYEDALFALLMDEVAQIEGEEAIQLNNELLADSKYAVPETVQRRCKRTIQREFARKNRKKLGKSTAKMLQYVSIAITVMTLLFTTAFAWSPKLRRLTLNAIINIEAQYSEFRTRNDFLTAPNSGAKDGLEYYCNIALVWVPEGYKVTSGTKDGTDMILYENEIGDWIEIQISSYEGLSYQFDSENAEIKNIIIQNCPGILVTKEIDYLLDVEAYTRRRVIWTDNEKHTLIDVAASNLTEDEIIQLSEGVCWNRAK